MTVYTIDTANKSLLIDGQPASEFVYQELLDCQHTVGEILLDAANNDAYLDMERRMGRAAFDAVFDPIGYPEEHKRLMRVCEKINRKAEVPAD